MPSADYRREASMRYKTDISFFLIFSIDKFFDPCYINNIRNTNLEREKKMAKSKELEFKEFFKQLKEELELDEEIRNEWNCRTLPRFKRIEAASTIMADRVPDSEWSERYEYVRAYLARNIEAHSTEFNKILK